MRHLFFIDTQAYPSIQISIYIAYKIQKFINDIYQNFVIYVIYEFLYLLIAKSASILLYRLGALSAAGAGAFW